MRATRLTLQALAAALLGLVPLAGADVHPGGPADGGVRATADLDPRQHMRNTGGSDGAGLCVFTSCEVANSRWQAGTLAGFQQWMTHKPGGGYPDKLDQMITQFCREMKRQIPDYAQHTGGDEAFLDLAMKTGRMVGVTYAGQDDFYKGQTIAHMVDLAHLDQSAAAIIDNNRPGVWVWMTRAQFLHRWRGEDDSGRPLAIGRQQVGGGWAVVFLDGPPPPYASAPAQALYGQGGGCECGKDCPCGPKCGCGGEKVLYGQCPGGFCPSGGCPGGNCRPQLGGWIAPAAQPVLQSGGQPAGYVWVNGLGWVQVQQPEPAKPAEKKADPTPEVKPDPKAAEAEAKAANHGIDVAKLRESSRWYLNGGETTKDVVMRAVAGGSLTDDSDRWFLVAVGAPDLHAKVTAAVAGLDPVTAGKLHVKLYTPDRWEVSQFALPPGVSVRKPAVGRVGAEAGRFAGEVTADSLKKFVGDCFSPPAPQPMPAPAPAPQPAPPVPTPDPQPQPAPEPAPPTLTVPGWLLAALAAAAALFFFRRKS